MCDVDWEATTTEGDRVPAAVVIDGAWHDSRDVLTADEFAACVASALIDPEELGGDYTTACEKLSRWEKEILWPILAAADQDGQLVTVVDIHE